MNALKYTSDLVAFPSISSTSNADVSDYVEKVLKRLELDTERIEYSDADGVKKVNVVGKKGSGKGGLAYFGHTDVVPADPWFNTEHGPFSPTVKGDKLYGRGSCDMKGSIGCILAAAEKYSHKDLRFPLYVTCTADEEVGYTGRPRSRNGPSFFAKWWPETPVESLASRPSSKSFTPTRGRSAFRPFHTDGRPIPARGTGSTPTWQ